MHDSEDRRGGSDGSGQETALVTSTMALSFAEVQQQLPSGVSLEKSLGQTVLSVRLDGIRPALGSLAGGLAGAIYAAIEVPQYGAVGPLLALAAAAYFSLAFALGRRRITLESGRVSVRTWPLLLPGDGRINGDFERVDVVILGAVSGSKRTYRIDVVTNRKRIPLVHDLVDVDQAMVLGRYLAGEFQVPPPPGPIQLT